MGTDSIRPGRKGCCGIRASLLGRPASYCRHRSYLVYIMCYVVSIIVKYYLTKSNKYGIIVVLRRKNALSYS